jgi:hypothetical protein
VAELKRPVDRVAALQLADDDEEDRDAIGDVQRNSGQGDKRVESGRGGDVDEGQEAADDTDETESVDGDLEAWVDLRAHGLVLLTDMGIGGDRNRLGAYVRECIGKWKAFISGKGPGETRDGGEDVEERDEEDKGHHDDENVGGMHRLGRFPVDFDDGKAGWGVCDRVDISNAEKNSDHVCPLHNAVQRHSCYHAVRDSGAWSIHFVAYTMLVSNLL